MLQGEKTRLTALKEKDLPTIASWFENADFLKLFDAVPAMPRTEQSFKSWIDNKDSSNQEFRFAIRPVGKEEIVGFLELDGILWNQRNAWLSIAIGDSANWNKGFGKEAMTLALNFCFHELNLHRVQLTVFEYNKRAIALYENLGFQKEGSYREFLKRDGQTYNMELYGILDREWGS
ncbi:MAG TPA: GNAT family protein [Bacillales bacterium]|nr:GNAT family protein [Bacillales bacterium]